MRALGLMLLLLATIARADAVKPADIHVVDGDTIEALGKRIRLVGFDASRAKPPCRLPLTSAVRPRGVDLQADGREPAQVGRHSARLHARRGRLPGSRWRGIVVIAK
jgi:hypothetical protein